ncbi:GNAT family N-acetyltransferase [Pseudomonas syringae]|nr:GNAT family N-acetyltransferase [Pseudomonas syringae]MCF5069532.1 GNAT family N-acetyltransferase [Pseudomonas syringae]
MDTLTLRSYRNTDARAVSRLFREVYGEHYVQPHVYLPHMINQNHAEGCWHSLVALTGTRLVGHATLFRNNGSNIAELALSAVHPDARGQNVATRLGQQLMIHAQALRCRGVTIKQVTQHPFTQRMAASLGFHNTGLLPDYVPSPFGLPTPESIVIGCCAIDGYQRPLPLLVSPPGWQDFMLGLANAFGTQDRQPRWQGLAVRFEQQAGRYDVVLKELNPALLQQLRKLPSHWLISLRLRLTAGLSNDLLKLAQTDFVFTGLMPDDGPEGWLALFHRGIQSKTLTLHCPHMQRLHDLAQQQAPKP